MPLAKNVWRDVVTMKQSRILFLSKKLILDLMCLNKALSPINKN